MSNPKSQYVPAEEAIEILTKRVRNLKAGAGNHLGRRSDAIAAAEHCLASAIKQRDEEAKL